MNKKVFSKLFKFTRFITYYKVLQFYFYAVFLFYVQYWLEEKSNKTSSQLGKTSIQKIKISFC